MLFLCCCNLEFVFICFLFENLEVDAVPPLLPTQSQIDVIHVRNNITRKLEKKTKRNEKKGRKKALLSVYEVHPILIFCSSSKFSLTLHEGFGCRTLALLRAEAILLDFALSFSLAGS